jgi:hypothetical protein
MHDHLRWIMSLALHRDCREPGCLSLLGWDTDRHRLLADHLTAECLMKAKGRGRRVTTHERPPCVTPRNTPPEPL